MKKKKLFMVNRVALEDELDELIKNNSEIVQVIRLRNFSDSELTGIPVTDWLILYKEKRGGKA